MFDAEKRTGPGDFGVCRHVQEITRDCHDSLFAAERISTSSVHTQPRDNEYLC